MRSYYAIGLYMLTTAQYRLAIDGDDFERYYWGLFIKDQFPSYETFWLKFVVPLTNRPDNIHFKTDVELAKINKSELDLCISQLNYSIFKNLARCFDVIRTLVGAKKMEQLDLLLEGFTRLVGAQDNAFELLERLKDPSKYKAFREKAGEKARGKKYVKGKGYPLQHIRDYRNSLVHGRVLPGIVDGDRLCLPDVGKTDQYLDWRLVTELSPEREEHKKDFISVLTILEKAWNETMGYLENNWKDL